MSAPEGVEREGRPTIGLLLPMSGERAPMGRRLLEAAKLSGDDVGVEVEVIDSAQDVHVVLAALDELGARGDVAAVIGPVEQGLAQAAAQRAQAVGLPMVVFSPLEGVERVGDRVFRALPGLGEQSARVASYLVDEQGMDEVAVLAPRTSYGDEALQRLIEEIQEAGGEVQAFAQYDEGTTDFRPVLEVLVGRRRFLWRGRRLRQGVAGRFATARNGREGSGDFEALIIADSYDVVARILPYLPQVGLQSGAGGGGRLVQLVGLSAWRGGGLIRAGEHGLGAVFFDTYGGAAMGGQAQDFEARFQGQLGRRPTTAEAEVYDIVGMIGSGVQAREAGESWAEAALARLRQPRSYPGVAGSWSFDEEGAPVRYLRPLRVLEEGRWGPAEEGVGR